MIQLHMMWPTIYYCSYLLMKVHQLPVDAFLTALKFMGVEDIDSDEVQCILANLIYLVSIQSSVFIL